jgi:acetylornithine deacetylase/succinyl-diaminopimelate desuccinylase-like protein
MINRNWPPEEVAADTAARLQHEVERNRTQAALDLERTVQPLEFLAELDDLSIPAHDKVTEAIAALWTAAHNNGRRVRVAHIYV